MDKEYNEYLWSPKQPRVYDISPLRISGTPMSEEDAAMSLRAENLQQSLQQNPIFKSAKQRVAQQEQREKEIAASKKWLELHPEDDNDDPYTIFERGKHQAIVDGKDPSYYEKMINDGKQFTKGALTALSLPYLGAAAAGAYGYGASLGARGLFAGQGIYGLANENGVRKTANLIKSGNYGRAALSGAGDVLNAAMILPGAKFLGSAAKYGLKSTVAGDMLGQNVRNAALETSEPLLNVGWGPRQTLKVSRAGKYDQMYFPERWDVVNEGANPHGVWLQGKYGTPRTDLTNPGKGTKAARARNVFSARSDKYTGTVTLNKPTVTVGEVPNRSSLSYQADNMGADGLIYNGVYDNGYNNNQVILSFRRPELTKIQLSEAERLGIPKHERDWDYQFFKSIKEGNPALTSYIRTKHFAEQSTDNKLTSLFFPKGRTLDEDMFVSADDSLWKYYQNNKKGFPIKMTHQSPNDFYVFDYTRQAKYPEGHFFFSMHDRPQFGKGKISKDFYIYDKNVKPISEYTGDSMHIINRNTGNYLLRELDSNSANSALIQDAVHNKALNTIYGYDSGSNFVEGMYEFAVPRNTQMKLVDPITYDNNGHIIKLSKRDDFKNPDFRYKQGGILKRK